MLKRPRIEEITTDDEEVEAPVHEKDLRPLQRPRYERFTGGASSSSQGSRVDTPAVSSRNAEPAGRTPQRADYQIGWICALPIELAAAQAMLDEEHEALDDQDASDENTYVLGHIGKHNVVIACLPSGQYGTTSAATVAKDMLRTFSDSLKIGLMVGIGGGIPSTTHDIRLGDIVVSKPINSYPGVVQYDMGRVTADGKLERTGSLNAPPKSLLTALAKLDANHKFREPAFLGFIDNVVGQNGRAMNSFGRPPPSSDRLFQPEHAHPAGAQDCRVCADEWVVTRTDRKDAWPEVFHGTIASANVVVKDAPTRDRLGQELGALCFEMEAAGLMQDFPCLVVRGICDYADSHKNKDWQGYAALAAAAYTKELLGHVPARLSQQRLASEICHDVANGFAEVNDALHEAQEQQERHHSDLMRRDWDKEAYKCHREFKTSDYTQFKDINPERVPGTCRWVLNHSCFQTWINQQRGGILWVSADPGCGKSVLSRALVDQEIGHLSESNIMICHFFFKDNNIQNNLSTALAAIIHQMLEHEPSLIQHILPKWRSTGDKLIKESASMWQLLMEAWSYSTARKIFCIFDALDECATKERYSMIRLLRSYHQRTQNFAAPDNIYILATSRPYADIEQQFHELTQNFPEIHLSGASESDDISREIDLVIDIRMQQLRREYELDEALTASLDSRLRAVANRTYLWLHLAIAEIREQLCNRIRPDVCEFKTLPVSVEDAYEQILSRIKSGDLDTVRRIFSMMIGLDQPVSVFWAAAAIGIADSKSDLKDSSCFLPEAWTRKRISDWCGLMVIVKDDCLHFLHQTVKEFLLASEEVASTGWRHSLHKRCVDRNVAEFLIHVLLLKDAAAICKDDTTHIFGLFSMASTLWVSFYQAAEVDASDSVRQDAKLLHSTSRYDNRLWSRLFVYNRVPIFCRGPYYGNEELWEEYPDDLPLAQLAAIHGDLDLVGELTSEGMASCLWGCTALQIACAVGNTKAVSWLLEAGAPDVMHERHGGLIQIALEYGDDYSVVKDIVSTCLRHNIGRGFHPKWYRRDRSLLAATMHSKHIDLMDMLVRHGERVIDESLLEDQPITGSYPGAPDLKALLDADKYEGGDLFNQPELRERKWAIMNYLLQLPKHVLIAARFWELFLRRSTIAHREWCFELLYLATWYGNYHIARHILSREYSVKFSTWVYYCCLKVACMQNDDTQSCLEQENRRHLYDMFVNLGASLDQFNRIDPTLMTTAERFQWTVPEHLELVAGSTLQTLITPTPIRRVSVVLSMTRRSRYFPNECITNGSSQPGAGLKVT
ncbi:Phosphorylase-like protein 3 [Elsinoe fawcettii]|nr:Phosphorylase-like protein 3 [Elsinoe fawcettii]